MVNQAATREVIRVAVGRNINAVTRITAGASGSTTTFLTDDLEGTTTTEHKGSQWLGTDTPNDEVQARVTASSVSSSRTTLTLFPAVTSTVSGDTAELWKIWNPKDIHDYINQAIREITGLAYDPEESLTLHADGRRTRFDIPSEFAMLNRIDFRINVTAQQVLPAGVVWDESVDADFTITQDTEDLLLGRTSTKFVVAGTVSAGDLASHAISSVDLSDFTHIEFPIKVRTAVAASDLVLRLSATANGADSDKIIAIPALSAQEETWVRVAMSEAVSSFDASETTAIISVALEYNANNGANTIWLGEVRATLDGSEDWATIPKHLWSIDKNARDLVLTPSGRTAVGYALLKLVGGDKPALLNADATVCEVSDWYVICRATALALRAKAGGRGTDPDDRRRRADDWELLAQQAKAAHHLPQNTRVIS
ncbi:hypothetical protein CMI37_14910 [Candidatus Pacearchaeota archaeon]|nr:hypothetical protein [Candidatus Pacearchaeota archaeon]|tara:strand:+ start:2065 stop:3342 length:1278 start_codon:yes stop_codon:yes gene_type:complete